MLYDVPGVVIAYDSMTGVVLLKPNTCPSLEEVVARYAMSRKDKGFWFAKFMWSSIEGKDKDYIHSHIGNRLVREVILGCRVVCCLEKRPRWQAVHTRLLLGEPKLPLPTRRRKKESGQKVEKPRKSSKLSNLARTQLDGKGRGGIILPPVGGRRPGSHRSG